MRLHTAVTLSSLVKRIAEGNEDKSHSNRTEGKQRLLFFFFFFFLIKAFVTRWKKVCCLSLQRFPPLLSQLAVLLPVCGAQAEQRLQTFPAGFYILIVYIHVVQVLLLFKDLFSRAWGQDADTNTFEMVLFKKVIIQ